MPEKKKTQEPKSIETRMSKPQVPKIAKIPDPALPPDGAGAGHGAAVGQPLNSQNQLAAFEAAMKLFHARKLKDARELFVQACEGPESDVAQRARLNVAMCDRRLEQPPVNFESAEDHYNYGVALLNTRKLAEARIHLEKAVELQPEGDHFRYALALAQALAGDLAGACENLRRAIEADPRNRMIARQDPDFASFASQPPFDALLYPEKKSW
jgi:tetratricopeptide (TPR) repeat protein